MPDGQGPAEAPLNAALNLLSARSRGVEELRSRLSRKGFGAKEISECILWLKERDLLDDGAFARAFLRDRLRFSPRSPSRLRQELTQRGIASAVAREATEDVLEEEGVTELELSRTAARSWVRKQGAALLDRFLDEQFSPEREKARRRLYGFLSRRGFLGEAASEGMRAGEEEARRLKE